MDGQGRANDRVVLTCWKDIAQYLGKGVRTVQRWEREFGLPVRRPDGIDHKSPVIAHTRDLDAWLESRWSERGPRSGARQPEPQPGRDVTDLIMAAHELRTTHSQLMNETSAAIAALVNICNQMAARRAANASMVMPWKTGEDQPAVD